MTGFTLTMEFEAGGGWIEVRLAQGEESAVLSMSYVTDGLAAFATTVREVVVEGRPESTCVWSLEPGEEMITLRHLYHSFIQFTAVLGSELERKGADASRLFGPVVDERELTEQVVSGLRSLRETGSFGNLGGWLYPFPDRELVTLEGWLR